MNKIAIDNGYFVIIDNRPSDSKCVIELGSAVAEEGLNKITLDENNGFLRYFINDATSPEKLLEKPKDQTFEEFINLFIGGIYTSVGIDKSLFLKRVNGKLVEYYD